MLSLVLPAVVALLVCLAAVPPIVRMARACDLLDRPDAERRLHREAVPRLGGIAVWLGMIGGVVAALLLGAFAPADGDATRWWGALAALGLMGVVGVADDVRGLRPAHKLLAQIVAAGIVITAGFRLDVILLSADSSIVLGWMAVPATMLWLVGVTNAFNLIDGLDGLAAGLALVALAAFAAAAGFLGNGAALPLVLALAGAMMGFLRYNVSPARIFLGDVGSLSIGFGLALLSVESARAPSGGIYMVVPLLALAFPILDTIIAVVRRWLRGMPLSAADGRHMHHQLVGLGLTHGRAAAMICLFAAGSAALGLSIGFAPAELTVALAVLGAVLWVLLVIHGSRWLQYHEFIEAQASFSSGVLWARSVIRDRIAARDLEAKIRNAGSVDEIRALLEMHRPELGFEVLALHDRSELREHTLAMASALVPHPQLVLPLNPATRLRTFEEYALVASWQRARRTPPLYAERVLRIVGPAVEATLARLGPTLVERAASGVPEFGFAAPPAPALVRPARRAVNSLRS